MSVLRILLERLTNNLPLVVINKEASQRGVSASTRRRQSIQSSDIVADATISSPVCVQSVNNRRPVTVLPVVS